MIDRIDAMEAGRLAYGVKAFTEAEDYFEHHFPGFPAVPGTILLEAMAQLAGRLAIYSREKLEGQPCWTAVRAFDEARFIDVVRPGDVGRVRAELVDRDEKGATAECEVCVDDQMRASAVVDLHLVPFIDSIPRDRENRARARSDLKQLWPACDLP
jgi:3-hydroxyacyl-[acyl-carrier-protein] dehydratase